VAAAAGRTWGGSTVPQLNGSVTSDLLTDWIRKTSKSSVHPYPSHLP